MKKLAFLFLAGILLTTANAQQFQFGVKAGANFSELSGNAVTNTKTYVSFNAGVFAKLAIARSFGIQSELVYSRQGTGFGMGYTSVQHTDYLNLPVLLKYQHFTGFFLETGPQLGILLSALYKDPDFTIADNKHLYHSIDVSWVFGAGYKIPMTHLSIVFRYHLDLSNVFNDDLETGGGIKSTLYNHVLQVGLQYALFSVRAR